MQFQLFIKTKKLTSKDFLALKLSCVTFIPLINVIMSTFVGILTFMSRIISCSVELSMTKSFIASEPATQYYLRAKCIDDFVMVKDWTTL